MHHGSRRTYKGHGGRLESLLKACLMLTDGSKAANLVSYCDVCGIFLRLSTRQFLTNSRHGPPHPRREGFLSADAERIIVRCSLRRWRQRSQTTPGSSSWYIYGNVLVSITVKFFRWPKNNGSFLNVSLPTLFNPDIRMLLMSDDYYPHQLLSNFLIPDNYSFFFEGPKLLFCPYLSVTSCSRYFSLRMSSIQSALLQRTAHSSRSVF